ncbi:MAG: NADH:flavin oxidoreductase [Planctomycetes bacterium]|nr:NADH:flavin oxidoreductase [Planctomycetota bacterium]
MSVPFVKIAAISDATALRTYIAELGLNLPVDDRILTAAEGSPLSAPLLIGGRTIGNRWCVHPMEGWDANPDGSPSDLTLRRWERFGLSGAKLIWGGEAAAVVPEGRANPRQTMATRENVDGLRRLLHRLLDAHRQRFGTTEDLLVGLQLTHSGRFCRPRNERLEPRIAYHHPLLDAKFGIDSGDDRAVCSDDDVQRLMDKYVEAAGVAQQAGFAFVDVKACHGYLLHEFLSAWVRPGPFGGDYAGRTRLLKTLIGRIRDACPDLLIAVRLSVFDMPPFRHGATCGEPTPFAHLLPYRYGFGVDAANPLQPDLAEPIRLLGELRDMGVAAANITCGSPYYSPHAQRPAMYPPSDGYLPPEDPLIGVARLIDAGRACKEAVGDLPMVGTGYTYLQDFLPHVAQAVVRQAWIDSVGLGRMALAYPDLPADCLERGVLDRKRLCRTFSDCTTAPRRGLVSGCFPLDPHYAALPDAEELKQYKRAGGNR